MLYWIFDLDHTLYELSKNITFSYSYLKYKQPLKNLLFNLPSKKILFTNGTEGHAYQCLKIMKLENIFDKIVARDTINDLKPNTTSYKKMMKYCNINKTDKCVFFEDSIINLETSKQHFNYITVYIGNKNNLENNELIDFKFDNIIIALNYFMSFIN